MAHVKSEEALGVEGGGSKIFEFRSSCRPSYSFVLGFRV